MSTPVAFVAEYPMGRNQAKMVESTTNVSSVEWNGNLQRFDVTPKTAQNWAEVVKNYDSCFVGRSPWITDLHCMITKWISVA